MAHHEQDCANCYFQNTCMLTTSSIAKAVQVCSSKALAAVHAIMAITVKIATDRIAIDKSFDLTTSGVKHTLQNTKKGYISERFKMI